MVARPSTAVALDVAGIDLIRRTWQSIAASGSFLSGAERLAIAGETRSARGDGPAGPMMSAARTDATRRVAREPWTIRPEMIDVWEAGGLDRLVYLELVSVVVRVVAVDTYVSALGLPLEPLPSVAASTDPDPVVAAGAERSNAWVPTVGPAHAGTALAALPEESAAVFEVHDTLYLSDVINPEAEVESPMSRPQMELIASRTSWLNECFY